MANRKAVRICYLILALLILSIALIKADSDVQESENQDIQV